METAIEKKWAGEMEQLAASPGIWVLKNFLSFSECDHLIQLAEEKLQPSTVVDPETGEYIQVKERSSSLTFLTLRHDPIVTGIEERIAGLTRLPVENGEAIQILRYRIGEEYKPHFDYFDPEHPGGRKALEKGGQRVATVLMYLSEVEEGGETTFPTVGIDVKPERGNGVLFYSVYSNAQPNPDSLHGSIPVIRGEKWVATKWLRQREYI